jgi:lysine 6-dehydrogenase
MRVLNLGAGNIGSIAAEDIAKSMKSVEVVVADSDKGRAESIAERIGKDNVSSIQLDATNHAQLAKTLRGFDLVMGFLPGRLSYHLVEACVDAHTDLVDVSYMGENPLKLNDKARRAGVAIVPDCGLAPGISNILVGHAVVGMNRVKSVHIMVGGLPRKPVPPLGYTITWSPESLIDEYTRRAGIIVKGRKTEVEALSGLEELQFPGVGKLEAFFTDGLRTLVNTIGQVDEMWEKTLRYPGHAENIKLLKALGFLDENRVTVEGMSVSPRKLTAKLIEQRLHRPKIEDMVALRVEASGTKNKEQISHAYRLLDFFDKKLGITAMARTTAYPASIVAQLILTKRVTEKGVVPPEKLGMQDDVFEAFMDELEKRNIRIVKEKT